LTSRDAWAPCFLKFVFLFILAEASMRTKKRKAKRGFAAMSLEKRREIARKGGQSVKPENRAFAQNRELAAEAGRKGGSQSPGKRRRRRLIAPAVAAEGVAAEAATIAAVAPAFAEPTPIAAE
jgi:general stress protein YciG